VVAIQLAGNSECGLVTVSVRKKWGGLCIYGVICSYVTHLFWAQQQIGLNLIGGAFGDIAVSQYWLNFSFLLVYWIAYTVAIHALRESRVDQRNAMIAGTLSNNILFAIHLLSSTRLVYPDHIYLCLVGLGSANLLLSALPKVRGQSALSNVQLLIGLTFVTMAIPAHLTDRWTSFLWTAEMVLLTWFGLRYERSVYRLFSAGLAVVMFLRFLWIDFPSRHDVMIMGETISWRLIIGLAVVVAYGLMACFYHLKRFVKTLRPRESQAFHLYAAVGAFITWLLISKEADQSVMSFFWALEACALSLIGWVLRDRALRLFGAISFLVMGLMELSTLFIEPGWWIWQMTALNVALFYGTSFLYRKKPDGSEFEIERMYHGFLAFCGSILLTRLLWIQMPADWLTLGLAIEGFCLVAAGFSIKDRILRIHGLWIFAVMAAKILFIDLAGAETIIRILSFIAIGVLLLLASLAYARFTEKS